MGCFPRRDDSFFCSGINSLRGVAIIFARFSSQHMPPYFAYMHEVDCVVSHL